MMYKNQKTKTKQPTNRTTSKLKLLDVKKLGMFDILWTQSIDWVVLMEVEEVGGSVSSHIGLQLISHASIYQVGWWPFVNRINGLNSSHSLTCTFVVPPIKAAGLPFDFGFDPVIQFSQWNGNMCDATKGLPGAGV